jgi:Flp pilus assembly protein CpaB
VARLQQKENKVALPSNKPQNRVLLLGGIVFALLAGFVVFLAVQRSTGTPAQGTTSTDEVVVAAATIATGEKITASELTTHAYPTNIVPVGYLSLESQAIGKIAAVTITAGTPITSELLTTTPGSVTVPIPGNQLDIAPGDVALAIPASGSTSDESTALMTVGYYIQAGDHIDILVDDGGPDATSNDVSYGFQDVPVLAVGGQTTSTASPAASPAAAAAPAAPTYLVIELPRAQAEIMTALLTARFASSATGNPPTVLKYVLRPISEYGTPASPKYESASGPALTDPGDNPVTPQSLSSQFAS